MLVAAPNEIEAASIAYDNNEMLPNDINVREILSLQTTLTEPGLIFDALYFE